jgi:carbamoyltransferase
LKILGINSVYHESAAALLVDGTVIAACEEERFSRIKHAKPARVDNPHLLPRQAIEFCLDHAGIRTSDVDHVAYSFSPRLREEGFQLDPLSVQGGWGDVDGERVFRSRLDNVRDAIGDLLERRLNGALSFVPHHLAHAASAYYPSNFDAAAILVVDGIAESACTTFASAADDKIRALESVDYPHSLGFLWEKISTYLGFSEYDACKTMGLAAYGCADAFADQFGTIVRIGEDAYWIDPQIMRFRLPDMSGLEAVLGPRRAPNEALQQRHADIAAALQAATNNAVSALLRRLKRMAPAAKLCLAGGVGLNCITNTIIKETGGYSEIFIPPAPHDSGTAVGAAFILHHQLSGNGRTFDPPTPYLGPGYSESEMIDAFSRAGLEPRRSNSTARTAANMIAEGRIVAWFQGRMEFGPRALGNRSLLADPRRVDMREILNRKVKHREDFRPFAPSILAEHAVDWFDLGTPSVSHEYMLFTSRVKEDQRHRIPSVLHHDGTARVQIVRQQANPRFHEVISHFFALTGVPLVLNTSFNDSEPIVCTPDQAIDTFLKTKIDALFMGDVFVTRQAGNA